MLVHLLKKRILDFGVSRFPNLKEKDQEAKVKEEICEHYSEEECTEQWWYERADIYIASVHGFLRFGSLFCRFIMELIEEHESFINLVPYIEAKMIINEKRTWKGNKHVRTVKRINYKTGVITEEIIND